MVSSRKIKEFYPVRKCPVCGGFERELFFEQRFQGIDGSSLLEGYDVVACSSCGAVFSDHIPPAENFSEYYANSSKYEFSHRGGEQHREEVDRVEKLATWLSEHLPKDCSLLDVGCATGELLLKLRDQGFTEITGLEPSHECVERARNLHGLQMIEGVLGSKARGERDFGAVILSAVLEHIPATDEFIKNVSEWISPNGYLVIEVPDLEFFDRSRHAPFQEMSVEHVNFFTASSLINLMGRFGFQSLAERHFLCPVAPGGLTGAVVTVLFQKNSRCIAPTKENVSITALKCYLDQCHSILADEQAILDRLVETGEPTLIWGTGTLCQRLLANNQLGKVNITAFVDSNLHYQGKELAGHPVLAPSQIADSTDTILIASWGFQNEITHCIREVLKLSNRIITFR